MKPERASYNSSSFRKNASGAALIELSLMLPILLGLMIGAVEYGRVFQQFHVASKGVTSAARYLARQNNATLCDATPAGTWAADQIDAKNLALTGKLEKGVNPPSTPAILPNWTSHSQIDISIDCFTNVLKSTGLTTFRGPAELPRITVKVQNTTHNPTKLFDFISPYGVEIAAEHTEVYVGG